MGLKAPRWLESCHSLRTPFIIAATVVAAGCGDHSTSAPRSLEPGRAALSVRPSFTVGPSGGPTVVLSRIRGILIGPHGDSTVVNATFAGDSAVLVFDVQITGNTANYTLDVTAFDIQNVVAYHATQDITVKAGDNSNVTAPILVYAAPDTALRVLHVSPSGLLLNAGASATLTAIGTTAGGQSIPPLHLGWTSRDPSIATVDDNGSVHAGSFQGSTWIVARTATNIADSSLVKVHAAVDKVIVAPATVLIIRGQTAAVGAELRDAGNHLIDDRAATFASSDATVATVSSTGVVQALKIGTATITATAEGKSATAAVTVVSPVDHVELIPATLTFASIHQTQAVVTHIVARANASVDGLSVTFSSSNPAIVTVDGNGNATAIANGTASISATVDGVTGSAAATVQQTPASVAISPKDAAAHAIGETRAFTAVVLDALGTPLTSPALSWASSNTAVATVSATGVATAVSTGIATITVTSSGKSDAARFSVSQIQALLLVSTDRTQIQVGDAGANLSAKVADANSNPLFAVNANWATTTPAIASVTPSGHVTGIGPGAAQFTGTANGLSATLSIVVTGIPHTGLTLNVSTVEKLPNGTQQFSVISSDPGPFVWSVNGVVGGNATFGTISTTGLYTAPAAVPTPATFDVCAAQANPAANGCAHVTINPVPSAGGEVIVFNDINMFDNNYGFPYPNNVQLFKNLVDYSAAGPRASQSGVMFNRGHHSRCGGGDDRECMESDFSGMYRTIVGEGFTITDVDDVTATITSVPANIKVLFLLMPTIAYSNAEINTLKQFAADGGRVVFVGERQPYYGPGYFGVDGIAIENGFLQSMGAVMRNVGGDYACIYQMSASHIRPHQVTTSMTGVSMACASAVKLGPNDYPLVTDEFDSSVVLAAVAKVDLTLLTNTMDFRAAPASMNVMPGPTTAREDQIEHSWGRGPRPKPKMH